MMPTVEEIAETIRRYKGMEYIAAASIMQELIVALAAAERKGMERAAEIVAALPNLIEISPDHVRGLDGAYAAAAILADMETLPHANP